MPSKHSWFSDLAFGAEAGRLSAVRYQSHKDALTNAQSALRDPRGVGLLIGPKGSGKTTAARELGDSLSSGDASVAVLDGTRLNARTLLSEILGQFGYVTELDNVDELLSTINMFATQQTRSVQIPVLIIDNADRMYPSGLRALNELASYRAQKHFVLHIILTGQNALKKLIATEQLANVGRRLAREYEMQPMTLQETMAYLHSRLAACGVKPPDSIFPVNICDRLHAKSGGWPGLLNTQAIDAIERAAEFPVTMTDIGETELPELPKREPEMVPELTEPVAEAAPDLDYTGVQEKVETDARPLPTLVLTRDGKIVATYTFKDRKVLIGRSEFADVIVADQFVSKLHALLLLYSDALVLLDLNSANGVTVNSTTVRSTILQSDDIIVLGNHRLKVETAPAISEEMAKVLQSGDTVKMKGLMDSRRQRLRKAIEAGREAFLAGRMPRKRYASASSPLEGTFF